MTKETKQKVVWALAGTSVASIAIVLMLSLLHAPEALFAPFFVIVLITGIAAVVGWGSGKKSARERDPDRKAIPAPLRRKVYQRAGDRCQFPGCGVTGRQSLHIHHVDMNHDRSVDEDNLIVVCPNHHNDIRNDPEITIRQVRAWAKGRYISTRRQRKTQNGGRSASQ